MLSDDGALQELLSFGVKQLPLIARGTEWVNGQSLKAVADLAGLDLTPTTILPPLELLHRLDTLLEAAARLYRQFPPDRLLDTIPGRPRSYTDLVWHIFNVADAFLENEAGIPLTAESYNRTPKPGSTPEDVIAYGDRVRSQFAGWSSSECSKAAWDAAANVYYGQATRHEYLERTTWHVGQHVRQIASLLADTLHIAPDRPPGHETWSGLPMPDAVWDGA